MTNPLEMTGSSQPFEQQLRQLQPVPAGGLEEMLYQAGWQAGRAAALATFVSLSGSEVNRGRSPGREHWRGFFSGAASSLVAAGVLVVAAAWSGWLPSASGTREREFDGQIAGAVVTAVEEIELATAGPSAAVSLATSEPIGPISGFNFFDWFGSSNGSLSRSIAPLRSQMLTTAPPSRHEFDSMLSMSEVAQGRRFRSQDLPPGHDRQRPEFLRYQPGLGNLPRPPF